MMNQFMINSSQDAKLVELLKSMQIDPNDADDLYRLYVSVQLLNYIVYHRNIYKNSVSKIVELFLILHWDKI